MAASRGREMCRIYCDDKAALLEAISHSDDRLSATEFVSAREQRERGERVRRMNRQKRSDREFAHIGHEKEAMIHER